MARKKNRNQIEELITVCEEVVHNQETNEDVSTENMSKEEVLNEETNYSYTEQESSNVEGVTVLEEGTVALTVEETTQNEEIVENSTTDEDSLSTNEMTVGGASENYDINGEPVQDDEDLPHEVKQDFTEEFPTLQTVEDFSLSGFDYVPRLVEEETAPMPESLEDPIIAPIQVELTDEEVEEANRANNANDEFVAEEAITSQKKNYVPETSLPELEIVPLEDENQPYGKSENLSGDISSAMEEDEETVVAEEVEERKPKMKIKEIKYGMTVIANLGNYENIRTHIEATAEIEENEDLVPSIKELSSHIRKIGREEYRVIKEKTIAKEQKEKQSKQAQIHTGNNSQLGSPQSPPAQQPSRQIAPQQPRQDYSNRNNNTQNHQPTAPQHGQRIQKTNPPNYNQHQNFNQNNR